jgi:integrase/recombinase XerD
VSRKTADPYRNNPYPKKPAHFGKELAVGRTGEGGGGLTLEEVVAAFGRHLQEDGKSPKTVESYVGDVAGFLAYRDTKGAVNVTGLKRFHVTSYRSHLLEFGYETATINKKINSLQAFNRYLVDRGELNDMVVDLKRDKVKVATGPAGQAS